MCHNNDNHSLDDDGSDNNDFFLIQKTCAFCNVASYCLVWRIGWDNQDRSKKSSFLQCVF